ncbi:MAG: patatin family protein [Clostridia bacterium]|nr:patatin family protein [Clostridia bacterium]
MRPKIGLALGAGGAKGFAHIGVLKVLEEENIPVDYIAGSSMGAAIGAVYSAGTDLDLLEKLAREVKNHHILDIGLPKLGLIKGKKALALSRLLTHNKSFDELNIPLKVVATDLITGERVVFSEGKVADAVRASISVPGAIEPYSLDARTFVDGAVTDRVPAQVVQEMGADIVLAVDLQYFNCGIVATIHNVYDVIMQSIEIMERAHRNYYCEYADIIIKPNVCEHSWTDFEEASTIIEAGKEACREILPQLRRLIDSYSIEIGER